ncbi:putative quinol monooxygenase [Caballeronia terrestris]|uniref:putative quinol monooxygenase n=1 Tax=Caballeronia terrestris TaxID=1226301 RepID=UPI000B3E7353
MRTGGRVAPLSRCLAYDPWRSDEAHECVFIERYVDKPAAQAHAESDHCRRIGRQMGALMERLECAQAYYAGIRCGRGRGRSRNGERQARPGRARLIAQWLDRGRTARSTTTSSGQDPERRYRGNHDSAPVEERGGLPYSPT